MLAYARASKPCSEATDIGYILVGVSVFGGQGLLFLVDNWEENRSVSPARGSPIP